MVPSVPHGDRSVGGDGDAHARFARNHLVEVELARSGSGRTEAHDVTPVGAELEVARLVSFRPLDSINHRQPLFAAASEVYVWINRFPDVTTLSLVFPDTEDAGESVGRYVKTLTEITAAVADDGDYALRVDA